MAERRRAADFSFAILRVMADGRVWSLSQLRAAVRPSMMLLDTDKERHTERTNEPRWYSHLSNQMQKSRSGTLVSKGFVGVLDKDQYRITERGLQELRFQQELEDEFKNMVDLEDNGQDRNTL